MKDQRKANLVVVYRWDEREGGLTPEVLGESIAGFGSAIREILAVARVNKPVSVYVEVAEDGSIELGFTIDLLSQIPFGSWQDLYDFFAFIGRIDLLQAAKDVAKVHDDLNAFFAKNAFDAALLAYLAPKLFALAKRQKKAPTATDADGKPVPKGYAIGLHKLVKKGAYKKAMRPFVENQVNEVEIRSAGESSASTKITTLDFGEFLSEKEQILAEYENDRTYRFAAQLVGLEKSMGEHLKFRMSQLPRRHNVLVSYPQEGKLTTDYTMFYGKHVFISAKVIRQSMYHKPKLQLLEIELAQEPFL